MARRVNKNLLLIITVVVLGGGIVAWVAGRVLRGRGGDPTKLIAQGDAAMAAHDWAKARDFYVDAVRIAPNNSPLLVKLGDAASKLTPVDNDMLGASLNAWGRAISVDPHNVDAINRLLSSSWEQADLFPQAEIFGRVRQLADQLSTAEPGNPHAPVYRCLATIRQSLAQSNMPQQEVDAAVAEVPELIKKNPNDPDLPFYLALYNIKRGSDFKQGGQPVQARQAFDDAAKMFDDARKAQPSNAGLQYRAVRVYEQLARVDPQAGAKGEKYLARIEESVTAARAAAKPTDPLYDDIQLAAVNLARRAGRVADAEKIVDAFYTTDPNDQRARIEKAKLLANKGDPASREQAIKLLSQDVAVSDDLDGIHAIRLREYQAQTLFELSMIRLSDLATALNDRGPDAAARIKAVSDPMDQGMQKLRTLVGAQSWPYLGLQGRLHAVRGERVEAIKSLEDAVKQMPAERIDYDLMFVLAQQYVIAQQSGRATEILRRIVVDRPDWPAPLTSLIELLLQENNTAAAQPYLDTLNKKQPDSGATKRLNDLTRLVKFRDDPAQAKAAFARMPESTRDERARKAALAQRINMSDEALRLLELMRQAEPDSPEIAQNFAAVYMSRKPPMKDEAIRVVTEGLKAAPGNSGLKILLAQLTNASATEVGEMAVGEIAKIPDPFMRARRFFEFYLRVGKMDEALKNLAVCKSLLKPDSKAPADVANQRWTLDAYFRTYVVQGKFDEASAIVDQLAAQNVDETGGLVYRVRLAMARGDYAAADDLGLKLVTQFGQFGGSWEALAEAQHARGKYTDAIRSYIEVRKRQPTQYQAMAALVDCYYKTNQPEQAKAILAEMQAANPDDTAAREAYLNHIATYEDPANAISGREKLLSEKPDQPTAYLAMAVTYFRAAQHSALTDRPASNAFLGKAYAVLVRGKDKFPDDGRFYSQMAEMLQFEGKIDQGRQLLVAFAARPAVATKPEPLILLADFDARTGHPDQAVPSLTQALQRSDNNPEILLRLAASLVQQRKFDEAIGVLDKAKDPSDPRVFRQRVETTIARGEAAQAEAMLRAQLVKKDAAGLRTLLATILINTNRIPEAKENLAAAVRLDPRDETARYLIALTRARSTPPDLDGAINDLIDLRNQNPHDMRVRQLLADLYTRQNGKLDNAISELTDALAKEPLNREVRLNLIHLLRSQTRDQRDAGIAAARSVAQAAEADPVLKTDPVWASEEAVLWMLQKRPPQAVIKMNQAIAMAPNDMDYRRRLLDILLELKDFGAVLRESDKLLQDGHDTWWLRMQRGIALARQQTPDMPAALAEYDKALVFADAAKDGVIADSILRSLAASTSTDEGIKRVNARIAAGDPDRRWRLLAAALYRGKGDFTKAAELVEALLKETAGAPADQRVAILRAAADIYQSAPKSDPAKAASDYAHARQAYVELVGIAKDDVQSLNNLACLLAENVAPPQPQQAKVYSTQAYMISRASGEGADMIADTQGWVLTLCGGADAADGLKILQDVVTRQPDFLEARYHLGESYLRQERPDFPSAEKELSEAMAHVTDLEQKSAPVDVSLKSRIQAALTRAKEKLAQR